MARSPIRPRDRFEIFQRDRFMCRYCGAIPGESELQIDHIVPIAKGGTNSLLNLITACRLCNAGKGTRAAENVPIPLDVHAWTEVQRAQERALADQIQGVIDARKESFQKTVTLICNEWQIPSIRKNVAKHVWGMVQEFGPDVVVEWLAAADRNVALTESNAERLRYMYGCQRNYLKGVGDANT